MTENDVGLTVSFSVDLAPLRRHRRGVYFLKRQGVIVYVGKSNNMPRRIWEHMGGDKNFDSVDARYVGEDEDLDRIEIDLILALEPEYNHGTARVGFFVWSTIHNKLKAAGIRNQYRGNIKPIVTRAAREGRVRTDVTDGMMRYYAEDVYALLGVTP